MRTEGLRSHQFHAASQKLFQKRRKLHETGKRLLTRPELNQQIHVAVWTLISSYERSEESQTADAQGSQLGFVLSQNGCDLLFTLYDPTHGLGSRNQDFTRQA